MGNWLRVLQLKQYLMIYMGWPKAFLNGDYIFTIDAHEEMMFSSWSALPHNIIGTSGRNLYGKLADFYSEHADDSRFLMDKRHYSAFRDRFGYPSQSVKWYCHDGSSTDILHIIIGCL